MSKQRLFKSNRNVMYSCKYHVVWTSKYRRKVLVEGIDVRLKAIVSEVTPQLGIHRFVKRVKGRSSRLLRQEFKQLTTRLPTLWTNSYFVATVGGAPLAVIRQYIESQKDV